MGIDIRDIASLFGHDHEFADNMHIRMFKMARGVPHDQGEVLCICRCWCQYACLNDWPCLQALSSMNKRTPLPRNWANLTETTGCYVSVTRQCLGNDRFSNWDANLPSNMGASKAVPTSGVLPVLIRVSHGLHTSLSTKISVAICSLTVSISPSTFLYVHIGSLRLRLVP